MTHHVLNRKSTYLTPKQRAHGENRGAWIYDEVIKLEAGKKRLEDKLRGYRLRGKDRSLEITQLAIDDIDRRIRALKEEAS